MKGLSVDGAVRDEAASRGQIVSDDVAIFRDRRRKGALAVLIGLATLSAVALFDIGVADYRRFWAVRGFHLLYLLVSFVVAMRFFHTKRMIEGAIIVDLSLCFLLGGWTAVLRADIWTAPIVFLVLCFGTAMTIPWSVAPQAFLSGLGLAVWIAVGRLVSGTWEYAYSPPGIALMIAFATTVHVAAVLSQQRALLAEKAEELARARDSALQASHTKSEFLANMSHEVRTPINIVFGMLDIVEGEGPLGEVQADALGRARNAARSLLGLINDILDLSKVEAGEIRIEQVEFCPRLLMEEVTDLMRKDASDKGIDLVSVLSPRLPALMIGDPHRLRQVLTNLVGNAIKFTERGRIRILVSVVEDGSSGTALRIAVEDTGVGIAKEHQTKIFQIFSQADSSTTRNYGGTGLGLAISRQLVELMGGTLRVESELGAGSTFYFVMPLPTAAASAAPVEVPPPQARVA